MNTDWNILMETDTRRERRHFSRNLLNAVDSDCLTRKPRDPVKHEFMLQLGLPEKYPEVQYPSPGNTPEDLDNDPEG